MCIPKDVTVETRFIGNWLILAVGFTVRFERLFLEPIRRNSVFVIFKVSLLAIYFINLTTKSNTSIIDEHPWLGMLETIRQIIYIQQK